jgi:hypothetical protein
MRLVTNIPSTFDKIPSTLILTDDVILLPEFSYKVEALPNFHDFSHLLPRNCVTIKPYRNSSCDNDLSKTR